MTASRVWSDALGDVSRETQQRLETYESLLRKWQAKINLVSPGTLNDLWTRHFIDSAQLMAIAPNAAKTWVDLGSGGGFPGLVCAILAKDTGLESRFTLVESDARKCSFLREVARQTGISVTILNQRIEAVPAQNADVVSARALAPLERLMPLAVRHLSAGGVCLFLKGAAHEQELERTLPDWHMTVDQMPSITAADSVILRLGDIRHASQI